MRLRPPFAMVLLLAAFSASAAHAQAPRAATKKPLAMGEIRVRLHAISEMVQTGQLEEADQAIALLRAEAGPEPLIDGLNAFLLYRRHEYAAARELLEGALKTPEAPVWWRVLQSMCIYAMGDEALARETIARAKNEDPRSALEGMNSMGIAAMHDVSQAPTVEGALTVAFLMASIGNKRLELNNLDLALRKFPKEPRLMVMRLNLLADASDRKTVLEETDKAVQAVPDSEAVQSAAGEIYGRLGNFEKAIAALQAAVRLNPRNYTARLNLGGALQHQKKLSEAVQEYAGLIAATAPAPPADQLAAAAAGLGSVFTDLKRWKEAEESLQKGLAESPESVGLLNNLAWLYAIAEAPEFRDPKKAIELATKADALSKHRLPAVLDTLAEAYFAAGDQDKAVEYEKRALALAPNQADFKEHLARYASAPKQPLKQP